ncbi:MAG: LysR family transcriptional regulator [Parasphingopyxis sp.]|nr:LysR family transcriptional regulator [Sphingomonadales bacterium]
MLNWDDLKYFAAVAEAQSTLGAAERLGVSQTTVARRIAALEAALGLELFERRSSGYRLTPTGEALLGKARAVEDTIGLFAAAASSEARGVVGDVRITTFELYATRLLAPVIRRLRQEHPGLRIDIDTSQDVRDLESGAADIALRNSRSPSGRGLVGRRIADDPWTVYAGRSYVEENGFPEDRKALARHSFIGGGGVKLWPAYSKWLAANALEDAVVLRHDSEAGLYAAVRSGLGLAVLPSFVADRDPELVRILPPRADDRIGLWLLTHERLRNVPRIRLVLDFIARELKALVREA